MVADVARAARQAVRDSLQAMIDRTQSQGFWGKAKQSVNPPVIRDNKATIDITHTGVRLQWLGGTVRPTGRRSEVTGRPIRSLLIPFKDSPLRRRSLASLHLPEEEVMVLGDVDTGNAILARVRQRKRRNRDGHYQDVTPLGALVKSATIPAHPEVMPSREQMREYAVRAATLALNRLLAQADGNSTLHS
ncbi:hypothetical protein [Faecalibaculum rodentium]|jgi:hypothetical protein|uniref:hypothetical protein n=3 Tax=Bacteria TaxID=2 RepID=UPI0031C786FC|nr:hypothetical protein [Akkermansia muciniphila]